MFDTSYLVPAYVEISKSGYIISHSGKSAADPLSFRPYESTCWLTYRIFRYFKMSHFRYIVCLFIDSSCRVTAVRSSTADPWYLRPSCKLKTVKRVLNGVWEVQYIGIFNISKFSKYRNIKVFTPLRQIIDF